MDLFRRRLFQRRAAPDDAAEGRVRVGTRAGGAARSPQRLRAVASANGRRRERRAASYRASVGSWRHRSAERRFRIVAEPMTRKGRQLARARAATGHVAAAPPSVAKNFRRSMCLPCGPPAGGSCPCNGGTIPRFDRACRPTAVRVWSVSPSLALHRVAHVCPIAAKHDRATGPYRIGRRCQLDVKFRAVEAAGA